MAAVFEFGFVRSTVFVHFTFQVVVGQLCRARARVAAFQYLGTECNFATLAPDVKL
jgi:hypothetical protein